MSEVLNLKGINVNKAQYIFIKSFWKDFGKNGNKCSRSAKSKKETLARLKDIGELVVFNKNNTTRNKNRRKRFDYIKSARHSLKSHPACFACGAKAEVRHHIIWIKNGGLDSKKNLISLCRPCHAEVHPWLKKGD